jgi:hypothetical protein
MPLRDVLPRRCPVLVVGSQHGPLGEVFREAGYAVEGLEGGDMSGAKTWPLIALDEISRTGDLLEAFETAGRMQDEKGLVVILDWFVPQRTAAGPCPGLVWRQVEGLAGRFGYGVVAKRVIGSTLGGDAPEQWLVALARRRRPRWRPGYVAAEQSTAMRELFARVFGHPMSAEHWAWKYGECRGCGVGVWREDGRLVGHYGGVSRDILLFGVPSRALQVGDVMVDPCERGALSRRGVLFIAASTLLEREVGYGAPHLLGVGFPNARANRLPALLGLYDTGLGRMMAVCWPARRTRPGLRIRLRPLDPASAAGGEVIESCWRAMAKSLPENVIGVRDAAYVRHRYLRHPENRYRFFVVRRRLGGAPVGVLVMHRLDDRRCELMDAIGSRDRMSLLAAQAQRAAAVIGCGELVAWLVDNIVPAFGVGPEARIEDLDIAIPGNAWSDGPKKPEIAGRWWLTGGDTDFR